MADLKKIFSKIYDQNIEKIYRFIFLKVNSQEVAEDLTSETFLRGWEAFKKANNPEKNNQKIKNLPAFLYQIARNLVIDYYREKAKIQTVSVEFIPLINPRDDLTEKAILNSDLNMIRNALTQLKEDYQNVIIWYYLNDLSIPEIAQMLGKTEEATRVLLSRALKALKNELNQKIQNV